MVNREKPRKILEVTTFFSPVVGGVETQVEDLSIELIKSGYEVEILTTNSDRQGKKVRNPGTEVINFEQLNPENLGSEAAVPLKVTRVNTWFSLSQFHKFAPGFWRELWAKDWDLVHVHGLRKPELYLALLVAKLKRKKIVVSTHNPFTTVNRSLLMKLYIFFHDVSFGILLMRFVDKYVLLAETEVGILQKFGIKKQDMVMTGNALHPIFTGLLDENLESLQLIKQNAKQRLLADLTNTYPQLRRDWDKVVLSVGRLNENKGFQYLEKAARELPNVLFLIVGGDDGYGKRLQQTFVPIPNVMLTEKFISRKDLLNYFRGADIFVLPSLHEPFGIVIIEAMSQGCAVVAARSAGPETIIGNNKYGKLIATRDEDALLTEIKSLVEDGNALSSAQQQALTRAKSFTWRKVLSKYTEDVFGIY